MTSTAATEAIATAVEAVARLAEVEFDQVDDTDALAATVELGRARSVVDGALTGLAERIEDTDAAHRLGWATTKDFLTHALGGRKGAGAAILRVAKHTAQTPDVRHALTRGEVSFAQASSIGQRITTLPQAPELRQAAATKMLGLVADHGSDATDLDRSFPGVVGELDPDGRLLADDRAQDLRERGAHQARFLSLSPDTLGGVRIKGYATAEEAELVKTTLMPLAAPVTTTPGACGGDPNNVTNRDHTGRRIAHGCPDSTCAHDGRDPRETGTRLWDALVEACRRLQASDDLPRAHGTAARITVTTSIETLTTELGHGLLGTGDTLSASAVRRLACDADILPAVLGTQGQVLDVGRLQRLVTTAIWNALVLRDQHCAFPGCTRSPEACDAHHITHWADGGPTSLDNLILLCRKHHTLVHNTPWQIQLDPATRKPVWQPPPLIDDRHRFSFAPARARPPTPVG